VHMLTDTRKVGRDDLFPCKMVEPAVFSTQRVTRLQIQEEGIADA